MSDFTSFIRKFAVMGNRYLQKCIRKSMPRSLYSLPSAISGNPEQSVRYVQNNETTKRLKIINAKKAHESNEALKVDIEVLDRANPAGMIK